MTITVQRYWVNDDGRIIVLTVRETERQQVVVSLAGPDSPVGSHFPARTFSQTRDEAVQRFLERLPDRMRRAKQKVIVAQRDLRKLEEGKARVENSLMQTGAWK